MFYKKMMGFLIAILLTSQAYAVNVNTASAGEIATALHGVGEKRSVLIVEHCQKIRCTKPEDLLEVKGIGKKTLEKIRDDLEF